MQALTKEQSIVLTGFTGIMCCAKFSDFHEEVEKRLNRPVWTHELANKGLAAQIKELFKEDFLKMIPANNVQPS